MKLLKYYFEILFPIPLLFYILKYSDLYIFIVVVLFYSLVYRQMTDGFRLYELKIIDKVNYKIFNPFYMFKLRFMHISRLYFSNN
jgi:hypothetical protein